MPEGINLSIAANTREFQQGIKKGVIEPLTDVEQAFKDLETADGRTGDALTDTFRDQQRATELYGRQYKEMSADIQSASRRTASSVESDARRMERTSTEGFDEIKDSARSNAIEVGASFTGGFDQAIGGLQGFVAEFLAGFGPAGIIAGVGAAALLGTITNAITEGTEATEEQKQKIRDLAAEYIEAGKSGRVSFDSITDRIKEMATSDPSDVILTLQDAFEKAKIAGADYQQVVEAIATSSPTEINRAKAALAGIEQQHEDNARAAIKAGDFTDLSSAQSAQAAIDLKHALKEAGDQAEEAARAQQLAAEAGLSKFQLKADLLEQLETRYDEAAAGANHFNEKTGEFNASGYLKEMKKIQRELIEYKENIAKTDLPPSAVKFLENQGEESAAAMLRGYQRSSPKQKAQLAEIWATAGSENATSYEDALGKSIKDIKVPELKVAVPVIPAPDTSALDRYFRQPHVVKVVVDAYTRNGVRVN